MTTLLALDASTAACSAALWVDGQIEEQFKVAPRQHADLILGMIKQLIDTKGITLKQIDAIAFAAGPGSFMGVRIAAGVAIGLAFGLDCPVIPVSTLQALAQTAYIKYEEPNIAVAWDARMQQMYWGAYGVQNNIMQAAIKDCLSDPKDVQLPQDKTFMAAGNAWQVYQDEISKNCLQKFSKIDSEIYLRSSAILSIANDHYQRGEIQAADQVEPVYLREHVTG